MEALRISSFQFITIYSTKFPKTQLEKFKPIHFNKKPNFPNSSIHTNNRSNFNLCTTLSSYPSTDQDVETESQEEKFDWYEQWYPIMPVCDLDKRAPHGKRVMGIDVVVWWDRNESAWKVFDDMCPHRLAPLSEGRIDQWGRLQCVYHGWCFSGSGDCKFIPQAPPDGPPVHTFKKACAAVYPSVAQNDIVWFWPSFDPKYIDILSKKKPPYIPELDDPSFTKLMGNRDIPYGYDVLIDNLMDPAHVPYAHYGVIRSQRKNSEKADREGGQPLEISVEKIGVDGFLGNQGGLKSKFMAPCVFYAYTPLVADSSNGSVSLAGTKKETSSVAQKRVLIVFICIPVSPGNSRVIWSFPRNFALWIDQIIPRWIFHVRQNLVVLDSDLYLLHAEERKLMEIGPSNWQKACYLPTKADAQVVAFRRWLNKYAGGGVDWQSKFTGPLPPTPSREQLMDRYWTHVVNCQSCKAAYTSLNALEVVLQVTSVALIGIVAATKQNMLSVAQRNAMISLAVLCFVGSRWLSHFVYKNFRFHDYNHAFR